MGPAAAVACLTLAHVYAYSLALDDHFASTLCEAVDSSEPSFLETLELGPVFVKRKVRLFGQGSDSERESDLLLR